MKGDTVGDSSTGDGGQPNWTWGNLRIGKQPALVIAVLFLGVTVSCLVLYNSSDRFGFLPTSWQFSPGGSSPGDEDFDLGRVLKRASMPNKTVIITTSNQAWAETGSIIDLFLESFSKGNNTQRLVRHLVIVSLDQTAHERCLAIHPHCFLLESKEHPSTEAYFMTPVYLQMMWKRIEFLTTVLEMGYNFVFTDADITWFQDPFPHFFSDADFQIACDNYNGNPDDLNNAPNGGFNYVRSNNRTIRFYKFWYSSRTANPGKHDQDVFNMIKHDEFIRDIGLQIKFLDTTYFGGFCQPSRDFNLVCTMHANCCFGLKNKILDLRLVLEDWTNFHSLNSSEKDNVKMFSWRAPKHCRLYNGKFESSLSEFHPPEMPKKEQEEGGKE